MTGKPVKKSRTNLTTAEVEAVGEEVCRLFADGEPLPVAVRSALTEYAVPTPSRPARFLAVVIAGFLAILTIALLTPAVGWLIGWLLIPAYRHAFGWL